MKKVDILLESSRKVLLDCQIENGAIVAANTDKNYFPKKTNNYRYVWPRDVAFTLYAAHLLGLDEMKEGFVSWLLSRAEDFSATGMIYQRYATHGARDTEFGYQYQPDQTGALLWVFLETTRNPDKKMKKAVTLLANSLCKNWNGKTFIMHTHDLWEERYTLPKLEGNFVYSLTACAYGLERAYKKYGNKKWQKVSNEMKKILKSDKHTYYPKRMGELPDIRIDASNLGLVWPFSIVSNDKKLKNTVREIKKRLFSKEGIYRYEHDEYDGTVEGLTHWKRGAGGWPLLTFWYVIILAKFGKKSEAKKLLNSYIKNFNEFIPEQVFNNKIQKTVSPLAWSHSMFVIAAKELGYF